MKSEELACLFVGALLVVSGVAVVYWPAALIVAGLLLIAAGVNL